MLGAPGAPDRGPAREHARRRRARARPHLRRAAGVRPRRHCALAARSARSTMSAPMPAARRCSWASRSAPSSALIASAASNTRRSASPPTRRRRRRCAASARHRPISRSRPRIDRVARHLGIDRIELRRRNLIRREEFPYTIPSGSTYDSGDYHAVLDKALAAADYDDAGAAARQGARGGEARRHRHRLLPRAERRQRRLRAAVQSQERDHDLDGSLQRQGRSQRRDRSPPWAPRARARDTRRCSPPWSAKCWSATPRPSAWCTPIR